MKIIVFILFNFLAIAGFWVLTEYKNKKLANELVRLEQAVESKSPVWIAAENFKQEKQDFLDKITEVTSSETEQAHMLESLGSLMEQVPKGISLLEISKQDHQLILSGTADSKADLKQFLDKNYLKISKLKRLSFEALGEI